MQPPTLYQLKSNLTPLMPTPPPIANHNPMSKLLGVLSCQLFLVSPPLLKYETLNFLAERIATSWIRWCWCCSSREDFRHYCWTALGFSCLHYLCKILLLQHCNSKSTKLNPKVKELHLLPDYGMVLLCKLEDILSFYCIYRILLYLSLSRSTWLF